MQQYWVLNKLSFYLYLLPIHICYLPSLLGLPLHFPVGGRRNIPSILSTPSSLSLYYMQPYGEGKIFIAHKAYLKTL